ncbi:succinate--CoA ligase subunit alpha [Achromobacter aloeverae]|uniref:Succinate--CoA ligase subunit alpha n=1 Tax=Achromobacter aloeverae TaxID=1750518 RepID=A0A4Q1HHE2_9BURK|nr:succinate--CoA ligase subunit alpha [Achromobacter aloeverae]RXN86970.1 succinate--CoA ligase subunit alpha [Achromobacter aloeverae]
MLLDLNEQTPVIVQGISGRMGQKHAELMQRYGTRIVGGTGRAKPGETPLFPVFADCAQAVRATGAVASIALVPPSATLAAVTEAADAGISVVVTVAEGVPVHDALRIHALARSARMHWLGASTPGLCIPGRIKMGFLPDVSLRPGRIGVMSKSGTLSYEVGRRMVAMGLGQSAWIGVGGDPVKGTRFADLAADFARDPRTDAVVLVGEIGGDEEEAFADAWKALGSPKPVLALIAGAQAKEGVTMGHAGAMVMGERGSLLSKQRTLRDAGARVFDTVQGLIDELAGC